MDLAEVPAQDRAPAQPVPVSTGHHVVLSLYWLANTLMWGALLHMALQSSLTDWFAEAPVSFRVSQGKWQHTHIEPELIDKGHRRGGLCRVLES